MNLSTYCTISKFRLNVPKSSGKKLFFYPFFGILIEMAELYEFDKKRKDKDTRGLTWKPREGHKLD